MKKIIINNNNEIGKELFSICLLDDPEFWIKSFKTLRTTVRFCGIQGYEIEKFRRTISTD
jgi:hypothetical protein